MLLLFLCDILLIFRRYFTFVRYDTLLITNFTDILWFLCHFKSYFNLIFLKKEVCTNKNPILIQWNVRKKLRAERNFSQESDFIKLFLHSPLRFGFWFIFDRYVCVNSNFLLNIFQLCCFCWYFGFTERKSISSLVHHRADVFFWQ